MVEAAGNTRRRPSERFTAGEIADDVSRGPLQPETRRASLSYRSCGEFGAFRLGCRGAGC